ncbi:MAG TPA: glycosyltransferase family 2 protein [Polyangiaceae bacterium]
MVLDLVLAVGCVPVAAASSYLFGLTVLSARPRPPLCAQPRTRFTVVVPAHDERTNIAATVESLLRTDYPEGLRAVLVVADNCSDDTADIARAAGASVLERTDAEKRGKGYALAAGFERIMGEGSSDAIVVVDADSRVSPNLLRACAARLEDGAPAVQVEHGVANPEASWRTRLMAIAFSLFHAVRSVGRERLGLSCGLRGNGMAFAVRTLHEVPYAAYSLAEDVEYGVRLGQAGHRVWYAGEAQVRSEMVTSEKAARSQRRRWEEGRRGLAGGFGLSLLGEGLRRRSLVLVDLAIDLLVPPLSFVFIAACVGTAVAVGAWSTGHVGPAVAVAWAACLAMICVYVARGVLLSGAGARGFVDLAAAPAYIAWKLALRLRRRNDGAWVRTSREGDRSR